jgi:hypothetical protein
VLFDKVNLILAADKRQEVTNMAKPKFKGGNNIAFKIPKVHFEKTVTFYRDVLGFKLEEAKDQEGKSYSFQYGPITMWLDMVENYTQTDVWLELETDNAETAVKYLTEQDVPFWDKLEPLPKDLSGQWISSPSGTVHLLKGKK